MLEILRRFRITTCTPEGYQKTSPNHLHLLLRLSSRREPNEENLQLYKKKPKAREEWLRGDSSRCQAWEEPCQIHDPTPERRWRQLDSMQFLTGIVSCIWVRYTQPALQTIFGSRIELVSHFVIVFDVQAIESTTACSSFKQTSGLPGLGYSQLQWIFDQAVDRGLARPEQTPILKESIIKKTLRSEHGSFLHVTDLPPSQVIEMVGNRDGRAGCTLLVWLTDQAPIATMTKALAAKEAFVVLIIRWPKKAETLVNHWRCGSNRLKIGLLIKLSEMLNYAQYPKSNPFSKGFGPRIKSLSLNAGRFPQILFPNTAERIYFVKLSMVLLKI